MDVIISPEEYQRLRQVQAYLQMLRLAQLLRESGVTADELFQASCTELEGRLKVETGFGVDCTAPILHYEPPQFTYEPTRE